MQITISESLDSIKVNWGNKEQEITLASIKKSEAWKNDKVVRLVSDFTNEKGESFIFCANRDAFVETMKEGDEEYQRDRGAWNLNTTIHKLYGLLDGKDLAELEQEITNISSAHSKMAEENQDWRNEQVVKIAALEEALNTADCQIEREKILKKIAKLNGEEQPNNIAQELKKMYFAAKDEEKPDITLANVTPDVVKEAYGDNLTIT